MMNSYFVIGNIFVYICVSLTLIFKKFVPFQSKNSIIKVAKINLDLIKPDMNISFECYDLSIGKFLLLLLIFIIPLIVIYKI
jgi:hypothetical protein